MGDRSTSAADHAAVLSEAQINSLRETVKRIGNCGRLEVAPGSKDATWLIRQIQCCVACASVTAGSVPAPFKGGGLSLQQRILEGMMFTRILVAQVMINLPILAVVKSGRALLLR